MQALPAAQIEFVLGGVDDMEFPYVVLILVVNSQMPGKISHGILAKWADGVFSVVDVEVDFVVGEGVSRGRISERHDCLFYMQVIFRKIKTEKD